MSLRIVIDGRHARDFGIGTYIRSLIQSLGDIDTTNKYTLVVQPQEKPHLPKLPPNFDTAYYSHSDLEAVDHVAFPAYLRRLKPDLVHIPLNRVPWFMIRPYVVTVHDMSRQLFSGSGWRNQFSLYRARRGLMRAAKVIAVSNWTRRAATTVLNIPASHVRRIYNAPDSRFYEESPNPEQDRATVAERYRVTYPYVLYAGNIQPQKNIPRLIEAFSVLHEELADHPRLSNIHLVIIGDEVSRYPAVRRAAHQSRAGAFIRFLGFVPFETLRAFYKSASVFAFPSLYEGFGLPPLEAMACGVPVLTSNVSSLPEVVGDAAVTVNPDNVFEIARGLKDILTCAELRQALIERGRERSRRFSWEAAARQVFETYLEACRS